MADHNEDRIFCHACGHVWLKNESGLTCPHCESDFTEIIEIPPDTTPYPPLQDSPRLSPGDSSRSPPHPLAGHNPWADDYEDTGPRRGRGFTQRTYRSPDGRFTFMSTTFSNDNGQQSPNPYGQDEGHFNDPLMPMVRTLDTIFHGLADTYQQQGRRLSRQERAGEPGATSRDEFDDPEEVAPGSRPEERERLFPRDADGPQPMGHPLGTLTDILELFRQDFGPGGNAAGGGVRIMTGPNPLAILSTLLNIERNGDAVYSQEELDRVISQLIDQNINGNAPPPAPEEAIRALPKKNVDEQMLGPELTAECSICMDPAELGTEVTELPCKHWFHNDCIEVWLKQHNTCPHCRRSINDPAQTYQQGPSEASSGRGNIGSPPPANQRSGAFHSGNVGSPSWGRQNSGQDPTAQANGNDGYGGGIADWVRNRFGGGGGSHGPDSTP